MSTKRLLLILSTPALIVSFVVWSQYHEGVPRVTFLNVGQGDAIHIRLADGFDILIDGGPDDHVIERLGHSIPFYDRTIEVVALSHPDADHVTGLVEVLNRFNVGQVLVAGSDSEGKSAYQSLRALADQRGIAVTVVRAGAHLSVGDTASLDILYPGSGEFLEKETNEQSLIMKLMIDQSTFLFTGDSGEATEEHLLQSGIDLSADVLKIGHHGSRYSSTESFLTAVQPTIAVISVGAKNSYGHPSQLTLDRLEKNGVIIWRTDQSGDVRCQIGHTGVICTGQRGD